MSETLREEKGGDQVAEDQDARDEPDQVLRAHSRPTPFTTRRAMRKKRAVSPRYSASSMRVLLDHAVDAIDATAPCKHRSGALGPALTRP
jgi:hypothetical protein